MRLLTRDRSFYRSLFLLAIPVALQNLITFAVNFADNLMVSTLGDSAVSGVYMGSQIQTFLQMFSAGVEGAILILAAQYWGQRNTASIRKIIAIGARFTLSFGFVITLVCFLFPTTVLSIFTTEASVIAQGAIYLRIVCLSYMFFCMTQALIAAMRSVEVAWIGLTVSGISLVVNIFLNYVLIFGKFGFPEMGIAGAAIATLASRIVETLVIVSYVIFKDKTLKLRLKDFFCHDRQLTRDFIRYGLPIVGGQVVWSINLMANSAILGRFPESVITAASVANNMNTLAYVTLNGMATAVSVITGKTVGAGKKELMKEYARTVQILFLCLGLITFGVITLIKNPFIGLFRDISPEAVAHSHQFIMVLAVTLIGTCYQAACLSGLVKAGGDVSFVFRNDTIFVFLVVLPSAILAAWLGAPPWVVFACLKCDQIFKCFVAVVKINSFNWMKKLTRDADTDAA